MGKFSNLTITEKGRMLLADVQAGGELDATRLVMGSGDIPAGKTPATMTAVVSEVISMQISSRERTPDGKVIFGGYYSNTALTTDFYFKEFALFARAIYRDDSGAIIRTTDEVLYSYGNAGSEADLIPAYTTGEAVEKQLEMVSYVGSETKVNLTIESDIYVAKRVFDAHASRHAIGGEDAITPASIGAARAGFGYGEMMTQISATSADQSEQEFCRAFDAILDAMPTFPMTQQVGVSAPWAFGSGYYLATIYKYSAKYSVVVAYSSPMYTSGYGWRIAREDSTWGVVEWINAPMRTNVSYRTTERIDGKAVYKKNVNGVIQYRLDGETEWKNYSQAVGAAASSHNHDERYYTESEVNALLAQRAPAHTWGTADITAGSPSSEPNGTLHLVIE